MPQTKPAERYASIVERAEIPAVVYAADILRHFPSLDREEDAALAIRLGWFGPWFLIDGKPVLLREDLKEHLRLRMAQHQEEDKELLPAGHLSQVGRTSHDG